MDYMSVTKNTHGHFTDEENPRHPPATTSPWSPKPTPCSARSLDALEATGQLNDTYIIFASDHGEMNMEHRQTLKNAMYEASARVPLIVAGPGLPARRHFRPTRLPYRPSFPPSWTSPAWTTPKASTATPLLPLCRGDATKPPLTTSSANTTATSPTPASPCGAQGPWKYLRYAGHPPQLFNLDDDPEELHNLAQSSPDIAPKTSTTACSP